jgi:hypothetical protein
VLTEFVGNLIPVLNKRDMHKEKFMIYRRDAKKGEATYSPKSHSVPHFEGHYVEGMEEWASWYCFNKKEDGTYEADTLTPICQTSSTKRMVYLSLKRE